MREFFLKLFDTSDFPARWHCGNWSDFHGWLHILSDLAIFCAYAAIPVSIAYFVIVKRQDVAFSKLYWFFAAFILSCGLTHLVDAIIFWRPIYRISALVKFITAVASWSTVILLIRALPVALALPGTTRLNAALQAEIEERKRSEAALQASSSRLTLAMQHSRLGDWSWDPGTDQITFSPRSLEILGLPADTTHTWLSTNSQTHPDDRETIHRAFLTALANRSNYDVEYRVLGSAEGAETWVSAKGRAEYAPDGRVISMLGTFQDITSRKMIEVERESLFKSEQAARNEAERASRMKDEFLATLSHELRTPLNAILGWAHLLAEENNPSAQKEGLRVIERNSRAQARLIDDLLDMSRIITGKIRFELETVDLGVVLHTTLESVRPAAETKQIKLVSTFDPVPCLVRGDPARLQQITWSLLANAIKFTPPHGRIEVTLNRVGDRVEVAVTDTGEGIWPEFLPYIFDRFRQADSSTTRRHGGLGLGLSIVKNLVELHGGTVSADSKGVNRGSCFRYFLPSLKNTGESLPALVTPDELPEIAASTLGGLGGTNILAVDDEADSLFLLRLVLERNGATVTTATSAQAALAAVTEGTFDILISDIGMPGMDGFQLIRAIRAFDNEKRYLPALSLTAFAHSSDRETALRAGFDAHISKPAEPEELIATVRHCISQRQASSLSKI